MGTPILQWTHFTKYYGTHCAVEDLNLTIEQGQIVGFVGKNGAGKTTTIRALTNMIFPTEGTITVAGMDSVRDAKAIKSILGYMPGDCAFYDRITCRDLLKLCAKISKSSMDQALELASYFELDVHKKLGELSLGNRKKVSILQALLKNGRILVLDEPTNGLDPLMQSRFFDLLLEQKKKGVTIFLSSHNLSEIERYCDRVVILKDGRIVDDLDMSQVKTRHQQQVTYTTRQGEHKEFTFQGDVNELVRTLSQLDLEKLEIKDSTIQEEFLKYYQEGENHEKA